MLTPLNRAGGLPADQVFIRRFASSSGLRPAALRTLGYSWDFPLPLVFAK